MAAYAGVASLMNTIEQIMNHRHLSASFENKQIESLRQKAGDLLDFITCNGYGAAVSKQLHDSERAIARAAHAAEDVIESHIVDQIHARSIQSNPRCSHDLQQIIQHIDASILEKVAEFKENRGIKDEELTISRNPMAIEETAIVGFDDELYQLKDELTGEKSSRCIISITGMGGTGKTTLARNVYELLIKQHFDIRAWATLSQPHNAKEIFSQLLSNQGDSFSHGTVDELGLKLHKTLSGRRYFIVLDDLWSVEAWDEVRQFFPDNGNRSRIVVTTRLSNVASH